VEEVAPDQTHQYGIVSVGEQFGDTFESWISPPAPRSPRSRIEKISGCRMYRPEMM
jgi:UTP--glucose-1-phosphate uridylyltransferase